MRIRVLLWAKDGAADALRAYEDAVLPLAGAEALEAYLADAERREREPEREAAIARTQLLTLG